MPVLQGVDAGPLAVQAGATDALWLAEGKVAALQQLLELMVHDWSAPVLGFMNPTAVCAGVFPFAPGSCPPKFQIPVASVEPEPQVKLF